jgi:hypothetical protein
VTQISDPSSIRAIQPRVWAYNSLRRAELWSAGLAGSSGHPDLTRIGAILLPHYSPEHGPGRIAPQAPQRRELGIWLYGLLAGFDQYYGAHPERQRKVDRVFQSFVDIDAAARDWRAAASATTNGNLAVRAQQARRNAAHRRNVARRRLVAFLRVGLERREAQRLHGEENTWIHLAARGIVHPWLRVCEQCALVFRAPRAVRCPDCRHRPVRIKLHPLEVGGWHVGYHVGPRWASDEFDRTVYYMSVCQACTTRFETVRPDGRLCLNCRSTSGRVRRHRGGSRTGRQLFRFAHEEGAQDWSISFNSPTGQMIQLTAIEGVVQTDDAEIARMLDANPWARRIEDPAPAPAAVETGP